MAASNQGTAMASDTSQSEHTGGEKPPNPDEKLRELQRKLDEVVTQISGQTNTRDTLKSEITALEKIISDTNQTLNTYSKVSKNLEDAKTGLVNYCHNKNLIINEAIKDKKVLVEAKRNEFDKKIIDLNSKITDLNKKYEDASKSYEQSQTTMKDKQRLYENSKLYQKQTEQSLKDLQNLKQQIEVNEKTNYIGRMYFLIGEINKALPSLNIKSQEDLRGDLHKTWKELNDASEDFKKKREEWVKLKTELEAKQQEIKSLGVDRVKNILASIGNM